MQRGDENELLSAYLDREVTEVERAQVESRLDASPDARAELDALAELSLCLRTLDRPQAPLDLKASVLQAIANRPAPPVAKPAEKPRKLRREWLLVRIAGIVTAACGLFVAVTSFNNSNLHFTHPKLADSLHETTGAVDSVAFTPAAADQPSHGATGSGSMAARYSVATDHGVNGIDDMALPTLESRVEMQPRPMAAPKSGFGLQNEGLSFSDATGREFSEKELRETVGKEVVVMNQSLAAWAATDVGDRYVANIDLHVVDVQKSVKTFQVLLDNNQVIAFDIPTKESGAGVKKMEDRASPAAGKAAESMEAASGDPSQIAAVFVDSPADRVTKALEELAQRSDVLKVQLNTPLALERLKEDRLADDEAVARQKDRMESLKRAEVNDVKLAYENQLTGLTDFDAWNEEETPVSALDALGIEAKGDLVANRARLLKQQMNMPAPRMMASRVPAGGEAGRKDAVDATGTASGNSLNYYSEVKLPLVNTTDYGMNNPATANTLQQNGAALINRNFSRGMEQTPQTNTIGNGGIQLNRMLANSGVIGRNRTSLANNREATNPLRVLVVFQRDDFSLMKAKSAPPPASK